MNKQRSGGNTGTIHENRSTTLKDFHNDPTFNILEK